MLEETLDYVWMLAIAAGFGLFGGVLYALLRQARRETSTVTVLGREVGSAGLLSSALIGAGAALAVTFFLRPDEHNVVDRNGTLVEVTQWDIITVVAVSIIVGSAGPSFFNAFHERLAGVLNEQSTTTTAEVGKTQAEGMANMAKALQAETRTAAVPAVQALVVPVVEAAANEVPLSVRERLHMLQQDHQLDDLQLLRVLDEPRVTNGRARLQRIHDQVATALDSAVAEKDALIDAQLETAIKAIDAAAGGRRKR